MRLLWPIPITTHCGNPLSDSPYPTEGQAACLTHLLRQRAQDPKQEPIIVGGSLYVWESSPSNHEKPPSVQALPTGSISPF